jgi:hypothetical protein
MFHLFRYAFANAHNVEVSLSGCAPAIFGHAPARAGHPCPGVSTCLVRWSEITTGLAAFIDNRE